MEATHFFGQGRLVAHSGRHPAQQRRHFSTGQGIAIDVVHKEQHIPTFVAERLSNGQSGQGHAQAVTRGLIHLTIDHGHLGLFELFKVNHARVGHLVVEVVALAGTLTNTGKHRQTRVGFGDVVDQLHHVHGLAHAGTAEQADLAAFGKRAHQINHLDAGFQQLLRRAEVVVGRGLAVDRHVLDCVDGATLVDRRAQHVHDSAEGRGTDRHHDRFSGVANHDPAAQAVGRAERDGAHDAVAELLLHFQRQCRAFKLEGVVNFGHLVARKFHVHHRTNTLNNFSLGLSHFVCSNKFKSCQLRGDGGLGPDRRSA